MNLRRWAWWMPKDPIPAVRAAPPAPRHRVLVGQYRAAVLWCREHDASVNDRGISICYAPGEIGLHLRGRHPETLTITWVYGHGRGPNWGEAYEMVEHYRRLGATVEWYES